MNAARDKAFPSHTTWRSHFGSKSNLAKRVLDFCSSHPGFADVTLICAPFANGVEGRPEPVGRNDETSFGSVYLLRSGRHYKIGRSNAAGRRERELQIQLPEKALIVHLIRTDDPNGIEAYWHNRFAAKRKNGEWFDLTAADIAAFRRRKFM
jgi:hypothetical protein